MLALIINTTTCTLYLSFKNNKGRLTHWVQVLSLSFYWQALQRLLCFDKKISNQTIITKQTYRTGHCTQCKLLQLVDNYFFTNKSSTCNWGNRCTHTVHTFFFFIFAFQLCEDSLLLCNNNNRNIISENNNVTLTFKLNQ